MEVAASSVSSSPRALSTSISVAEVAGLEKFIIHSVRTEVSVGGTKCRKKEHSPRGNKNVHLELGQGLPSLRGDDLGLLGDLI